MTRPISRKEQARIVTRQTDIDAMEAYAAADNGAGAKISAIVAGLSNLLSDANYQAFRKELVGLDLGQRLAVCKKWLSMVLVMKAAISKNAARQNVPGGRAAFSFYKRIEDARACGWTIQDAHEYSAVVKFAYWSKADIDESGRPFDDSYTPF